MTAEALRDIIHLFEATRARQLHLTSNEQTLRDMKRLPAHLIEDVNARGLPLDHCMPPSIDNRETDKPAASKPEPRTKVSALRSV